MAEPSSRMALPLRWLKIGAAFSSYQLALQAVNFIAGVLVVRNMEKPEYALVTIAITMLGTMVVLSNMGVTIAITSIGGRVHADARRFGGLVRTALRLRGRLAAVAVPVIGVLLVVMLHINHATAWQIVWTVAIVIASILLEIRSVVLTQVFLLRSQVRTVQLLELLASGTRLTLLAAFLVTHSLTVLSVLAAGWVGVALRNWQLNRMIRGHIDLDAPEEPEDQREIMRLIRMQALNSLFFCIQGQLSVWILGWASGSDQVADVGALQRCGVVVSFLNSFVGMVLVPGFARQQELSPMRRRYLAIMVGICALSLFIVAAVWLFPQPILFVLGDQYASLRIELLLMVANLMFGFVVGTTWALNAARGWITFNSYCNIPLTIGAQIILALLIDLHSVRGVLLLSLFSGIPNALLCLGDSWLGFHRARLAALAALSAAVDVPAP